MSKLHFFYSYVKTCPDCGSAVVGGAVTFWHRPRCCVPDFDPVPAYGWFYWDEDAHDDPVGPFESETLAVIASARRMSA